MIQVPLVQPPAGMTELAGHGKLRVKTKRGEGNVVHIILTEVAHMSNSEENLVSLDGLVNNKLPSHASDNCVRVWKPKMTFV